MTTTQRALSRDTQATLLLVARLGDKPRLPPLNRREYNALAGALHQQEVRPGDLLEEGTLERLRLDPRVATTERLRLLLDRASALAFATEGWANAGLWVIGRGDPEYPVRIRRALRAESPPLFYGAGPVERLQEDGVGVVGSRDVDEAGAEFARLLGRLCAAQHLTVISGAARGVDSEAMLAAVDGGGGAVGIVPGDLERHALSKLWRGLLRDESVTLLSPFEPSARFTVGYAMERNRYVYTMSRFVTVVSSAKGEGGTWAGAVENLEAGWAPLVVRADDGAPAGNAALLRRGATPLRREDLSSRADLRALYRVAAGEQRSRDAAGDVLELPLKASDPGARKPTEAPSPGRPAPKPPAATEVPVRNERAGTTVPHVGPAGSTDQGASAVQVQSTTDVFALVWPYLESATAQPRTFDELKARFPGVLESQLRAWIGRAVEEGRLRRSGRPPHFSRG